MRFGGWVRLGLVCALACTAAAGCADGEGVATDGTVADGDLGASAASTTTTEPEDEPTGPTPTVDGPVSGGSGVPALATSADLDAYGYVEEEFFLSGTATAYRGVGEWGSDGRWQVEAGGTAPYAVRILVRRPADPADFNGVVVAEWLNVTGGAEADPNFGFVSEEALRSGFVWVDVTAQPAGVAGLPTSLTVTDPERYGALSHPGDAYVMDIYTQAGRAVRSGAVLGDDYEIEALLADGESQSAMWLVTYYNAIQPVAEVYDGFLLQSRFAFGWPLEGEAQAPTAVQLRTDLDAPAMVVLSETDVPPHSGARQVDSEVYRLWEIAGTAHADRFVLESFMGEGNADYGLGCAVPINSAQQHWVLKAALRALADWVVEGVAPAEAPRLVLDPSGVGGVARDELGIALGGIRLPDVDVPVAVESGFGNGGSNFFCRLFGTSTPLDPVTLAELYPSAEVFEEAYVAAAESLVEQGFLLPEDLDDARERAEELAADLAADLG